MSISARESGSEGPSHGGQFPSTASHPCPLPPHLYCGFKHTDCIPRVSHGTTLILHQSREDEPEGRRKGRGFCETQNVWPRQPATAHEFGVSEQEEPNKAEAVQDRSSLSDVFRKIYDSCVSI